MGKKVTGHLPTPAVDANGEGRLVVKYIRCVGVNGGNQSCGSSNAHINRGTSERICALVEPEQKELKLKQEEAGGK